MQLCKIPYSAQGVILLFHSRMSELLYKILFWPGGSPNSTCTDCPLESCCADLAFTLSSSCRYAHPGHSAAGHPAHAGQCAAALLLCLLHFRHRRRPAMGRPPPEPLFCGRQHLFVSAYSVLLVKHSFFFAEWCKIQQRCGPKTSLLS